MRIRKTERFIGKRAFTLVEVMFSMAIIAIVFVSLYAAIAGGFGIIVTSRENLRATQILQEQAETVRLLTWDQVVGNVSPAPPWSFNASFYPAGGTNQGITYYGTISVSNAPLAAAYATNLNLIVISLTWTNRNLAHNRELRNTLLSLWTAKLSCPTLARRAVAACHSWRQWSPPLC